MQKRTLLHLVFLPALMACSSPAQVIDGVADPTRAETQPDTCPGHMQGCAVATFGCTPNNPNCVPAITGYASDGSGATLATETAIDHLCLVTATNTAGYLLDPTSGTWTLYTSPGALVSVMCVAKSVFAFGRTGAPSGFDHFEYHSIQATVSFGVSGQATNLDGSPWVGWTDGCQLSPLGIPGFCVTTDTPGVTQAVEVENNQNGPGTYVSTSFETRFVKSDGSSISAANMFSVLHAAAGHSVTAAIGSVGPCGLMQDWGSMTGIVVGDPGMGGANTWQLTAPAANAADVLCVRMP